MGRSKRQRLFALQTQIYITTLSLSDMLDRTFQKSERKTQSWHMIKKLNFYIPPEKRAYGSPET